jgi:hypothetical protein
VSEELLPESLDEVAATGFAVAAETAEADVAVGARVAADAKFDVDAREPRPNETAITRAIGRRTASAMFNKRI